MATAGSLEALRELNRLRVIDALRQRGTASRSEIAQAHRALAHDRHDARQRPPGQGPRRRAAARRVAGTGPAADAPAPRSLGRRGGRDPFRPPPSSGSRSRTSRRPCSPSGGRISTSTTRPTTALDAAAELVDVVLAEAGIERSRVVGAGVALSGPVDARRHRRLDRDPARLGRAERGRRAHASGSTFRSRSTTTRTSARSPRSRSAPAAACRT